MFLPVDEINREDLRNMLLEIGSMHMPFGKYGPTYHPPSGVPLHDLPLEYLTYFRQHGFPKGQLGELMERTWELKAEGLDAIFEPLRKAAGGRTRLKPERHRIWSFKEEAQYPKPEK